MDLDNTADAPMTLALKGNTSQASDPTPDSPVDVNVVSGDNTIEICGKNECDIENLTFKNGYYSASGVWTGANNNGDIEYINVLPNTSYTFSINTRALNITICEFNKDKTLLKEM